jgi:hypothetical protein
VRAFLGSCWGEGWNWVLGSVEDPDEDAWNIIFGRLQRVEEIGYKGYFDRLAMAVRETLRGLGQSLTWHGRELENVEGSIDSAISLDRCFLHGMARVDTRHYPHLYIPSTLP